MNNNNFTPTFWSKSYSSKFIFTIIISLIAGFLLFSDSFIATGFILYLLFTAILFFKYLEFLPKYFAQNNSRINLRLFLFTFVIRLLFVIGLYIYFYSINGTLFAPNAADATGYFYIPLWMVNDLWAGKLDLKYYLDLVGGFSDFGYILYMFIWYLIFGPHLWVHGLSNLVIGSWSVVLIYKIAKNQFNHNVGIVAAIMMMLQPYFYYFSAEALKEMVLIWLTLYSIYFFQRFLLKKGFFLKNLLWAFLFLFSIILFRTFLAGLIILSFIIALIIGTKKRTSLAPIIIGILSLSIFIPLANFTGFSNKTNEVLQNSTDQFEHVVGRRGGNTLVENLASKPLFIMYSIPGPFPSFVNIPGQENIWLQSSASFIRNFLMFFYLIGFYFIIRHDLRKNLFLLIFTLGYMIILGYSGYVSSNRYNLPLIPMLMMYSAVGLEKITPFQKKYLNIYLVIICLFILGWNYFKLAGRGMI